MLYKLLFVSLISLIITKDATFAMFEEEKSEELTGSQVKQIFSEHGVFYLHTIKPTETDTRLFYVQCHDKSYRHLPKVKKDAVFKGVWAYGDNGWLFSHRFSDPIVQKGKQIYGIIFFVHEFKPQNQNKEIKPQNQCKESTSDSSSTRRRSW